jgi:hypothetical protein
VKSEPSAFLLEIKQRVPGYGGSWGAALAYGIDYPALYMIKALDERERFRALAQPFASGAQQWVDSVFINPAVAGVFDGEDVCQELAAKRRVLMAHVHYSNCYYKKGELVQTHPQGLLYLW